MLFQLFIFLFYMGYINTVKNWDDKSIFSINPKISTHPEVILKDKKYKKFRLLHHNEDRFYIFKFCDSVKYPEIQIRLLNEIRSIQKIK